MFIAHTTTGKTLVEGRNVPNWDAVDLPITSLELTLPNTKSTIKIGRYDKYYCAYQAVSVIAAFRGLQGSIQDSGTGTITHQIMAGIDETRGEVVYITLDVKTGGITVEKFDRDKLQVAEHALRGGE